MKDPKRYDHVPISEKTKAGMSLNIDDLAAIGRLLSLQDDAYEEQFEQILKSIGELRKDVNELKLKVQEITKVVDCVKIDVEKLKRVNSFEYYAMRVAAGVAIALIITRILHGPF
jgi:hypothetical protein